MMEDCLSKIKEMAYLNLSIHCEKCNKDFEIAEQVFDPVENWAQMLSESAIKQGWRCLSDGTVLCPSCLNFDKLINNLQSKDYHVVRKSIEALGEINAIRAVEAILPTLGSRLKSDNDCKVNFTAVAALKKMGEISLVPSIQALQRKRSFFRDDNWRRYWVARALGIRDDSRVIDPLLNILKTEENKRVLEGVVDALNSLYLGSGFGDKEQEVINRLDNVRNNFVS